MSSEDTCGSVCPYYHRAIELVGKRWTGAILLALFEGPAHFAELSRTVPGLSDRLLSARLKELEAEELVTRSVVDGVPVRVLYQLTDKGRALRPALEGLGEWARRWNAPADVEAQPATAR
ncbi:MAG: winged helix-turn-helix transcriptional regulator [Solirubrobacterales bacterium]